jgi:hypothetical protein
MFLFKKPTLLAFSFLLVLNACGGGGGGDTTPPDVTAPADITVEAEVRQVRWPAILLSLLFYLLPVPWI